MMPALICSHFFPRLARQCDAGLRAPHDCSGCPAYHDGSSYLGLSPHDQERREHWAGLVRAPVTAHFRGQP